MILALLNRKGIVGQRKPLVDLTGDNIQAFFEGPSTLKKMMAASDGGRPAVDPLEDDLLKEFGSIVRVNWVKMWLGRVAKSVMEAHGYDHEKYGVPIQGKVFTTGSVYKKHPS